MYLLVAEEAVLDLDLLEAAVVEADRVPVFFLPLLSNFLLRYHHAVGSLLVTLVPFLGFKELVFEMGNLDVAFVVELVDTAMEDDLESVQLRDSALFLVSQLVDELAEALVVVEVTFVVTHVGVKLDLLLVLEDRRLLPLILHHL